MYHYFICFFILLDVDFMTPGKKKLGNYISELGERKTTLWCREKFLDNSSIANRYDLGLKDFLLKFCSI